MLPSFLRHTIYEDIVVIDSLFPQKQPFAFRNAEINQYFARLDNFSSYTMFPMAPDKDAWFTHGYGTTRSVFMENKKGYLQHYPNNEHSINYLDQRYNYRFGLAYSFFLAETYVLLPFFERHKIPFVFVLYPGGCFALNNQKSDDMLRKIFRSPWFCGVIVTQAITKDYIADKDLCPAEKVHYIYGGFVQFTKKDVLPKRRYRRNKATFDICFVAAKYSEKGVDKGYDLFIEAAKRLHKVKKDIKFHVIGGFGPDDIDVTDLASSITFYGYKQPDFLRRFYRNMDIFLGPNRPSHLYPGSFDGFPLGIDAGYCGVALFVADELRMNRFYVPEEDIVIVQLDAKKIARQVLKHYNNIDAFYELSRRGQATTQRLFDIDCQIQSRLDVFSRFIKLKSHTS